MILMQVPNFLGPIFLKDQKLSGPKKFRGPNDIEDYFSTGLKFLTPVEKFFVETST